MAHNNIGCKVLINEVQKRPLLWNTADENYKDKIKKNTAWIEVKYVKEPKEKTLSGSIFKKAV